MAQEKTVIYNGTTYSMPSTVTPSTALDVMKRMCPELGSAAYAVQNGDGSITIFGEAQRKSADVRTVYAGGKQVIYNGTTYSMPADVTPSTALDVMKRMCPELGSAAYATQNADGTITIFGEAQRKSADKTVIYNGTTYSMPSTVTPSTALDVMKRMCPELGSAAYAVQNGDGSITIFGEAQRKSADKTVIYNGTTYSMPATVTPSTALDVMKRMCPELGSAAYAVQNGDGSITIFGEAQRKSVAA